MLLDVARAHLLRREHTATVALLHSALNTEPEATIYSLHRRAMVLELQHAAWPMLRSQVIDLADRMGVSR